MSGAAIRDAVVVATGEDALRRVAGLTMIKRTVLTLGRAGATQIRVVATPATAGAVAAALSADPDYSHHGIAIDVLPAAAAPTAAAGVVAARAGRHEPFVVATADTVFDLATARAATSADLASPAADAVVVVPDALVAAGPALLAALERNSRADLPATLRELATAGRVRTTELPPAALVRRVDGADAARAAERALLQSLRKPADGPVSRRLNRHVSIAITRYLLRAPITPNHVTLACSLVGFVGMWLVLQATWAAIAAGGVLLQLASIVDGCDGEIARMKFKHSRSGAFLDHFADDVSTVGYGLACGWVAAATTGHAIFWWLGIAGAVGFAIYDVVLVRATAPTGKTPFDFRWWFQREDAYLKEALAKKPSLAGRITEVFHATGRRDVLCFAWMWLAIANVPAAIAAWAAVIGAVHGGLAIVHTVATAGRVRDPARA
jgi:phosphatidylglycerophosphate synthase